MFSHNTWCIKSGEYLILKKNLKGKRVGLYGIEVSTPYVIDEGTVSTYGFVYPANHEVQNISASRKIFLTERGKSIQIPRYFFNANYNRKKGKILYSYK